MRRLRRHAAPRLEAPRHLRQEGARVLPQRPHARAELAGRPRGQLQPGRRFNAADVQPGLFWCEDLRKARRQLMAAGESLKVAISSPAQYCGLS